MCAAQHLRAISLRWGSFAHQMSGMAQHEPQTSQHRAQGSEVVPRLSPNNPERSIMNHLLQGDTSFIIFELRNFDFSLQGLDALLWIPGFQCLVLHCRCWSPCLGSVLLDSFSHSLMWTPGLALRSMDPVLGVITFRSVDSLPGLAFLDLNSRVSISRPGCRSLDP